MLVCAPLLFPLGRFFFDDFETFKCEVGLDSDFDRSLWLLGFVPSDPMLYMKIIGFFAIYAGATIAVYQLLSKFI
jgi:hypothetical protein